jgi:hypothetical protein
MRPSATKRYWPLTVSSTSMITLAAADVPSTPLRVSSLIPTISPPILATGNSPLTAWRMTAIQKSVANLQRASIVAHQPAASRSSGNACSGTSHSNVQLACESSLAMFNAPSCAMRAIITPRPMIKALKAASFTWFVDKR